MKKLLMLFGIMLLSIILSGCLVAFNIGYNNIYDNDKVTTTTGNISDTSLDVGALP